MNNPVSIQDYDTSNMTELQLQQASQAIRDYNEYLNLHNSKKFTLYDFSSQSYDPALSFEVVQERYDEYCALHDSRVFDLETYLEHTQRSVSLVAIKKEA